MWLVRLKIQEPHRKTIFYGGVFLVVPRPGIEPGWIAPLVFETSASTDSAIWAWRALKRRCKDIN